MNAITLPESVANIISQLKENGYEAYAVGGCVRDTLLGREPHDYDICTSATPEQTESCFASYRVIETGIKHGTVTVLVNNEPFEITTFRIDGEYSDNRHPDHVEFTKDIVKDLARRDFTINAMATDGQTIVDPFGGKEDLAAGIVKCVGNPEDRFCEDALRILRALRFASTYDFNIDPLTSDAIHRCGPMLDSISRERVQTELVRMLFGKHVFTILHDYSDIITTIIPELKPSVGFDQNNKYHLYTVYDHIMHAVENYQGDDPAIKVALLLHDVGKPACYFENETGGHFYGHAAVSRDMAEPILERLRFDNHMKNEILTLIGFHDTKLEPSARSVKRYMNRIGQDVFMKFLDVRYADVMAHSEAAQPYNLEKLAKVRKICEEIEMDNACFKIKDLAVDGYDMMNIGYPKGPAIGKALQALLDAVMDGTVVNERAVLIAFAYDRKRQEDKT